MRVALALRDVDRTREAFAAGGLSGCRVRLLIEAGESAPEAFSRDEGLLVAQARANVDSSDRPGQRGEPPHLVLTLALRDLAGDTVVDLDSALIPAESARRLTCDANLTPVVLDGHGLLVAVGRRTGVVPPALRRALNQRDQPCTHPGCDVPSRRCDAHHVRHWAQGGATAAGNLQLLCRRHHRLAHDRPEYPLRQ